MKINGNGNGKLDAYAEFLDRKTHSAQPDGLAAKWMPSATFQFQQDLISWALHRARAAIFADCGMGKTLMQLAWAQNVVEHSNGRVLVLTPIAVGAQSVIEGDKFGIECHRSRDGELPGRVIVTNYEQLHKFQPADFAGVVCDESSILKHSEGATRTAVTRFMAKVPYRLLCTATAAPNDWTELGTSSEANPRAARAVRARARQRPETAARRSEARDLGVPAGGEPPTGPR